jgi:hypothetical protein
MTWISLCVIALLLVLNSSGRNKVSVAGVFIGFPVLGLMTWVVLGLLR